MAAAQKYSEYFEINKNYHPCFNPSAINDGADWKDTFPHETFIALLKTVEKMLARQTKRSVWIHGAYGTGKSVCAYALKRILEERAEELQAYWNRYGLDKKESDLLGKLLAAKKGKIIAPHRYSSGDINSTRDLLMVVQESVKKELQKSGASYLGEETLKDAVIAWIEKPEQKFFFNSLLQKDDYKQNFPQTDAEQILSALRGGGNVKYLMNNIFDMAGKEGITAFTIDTDILKAWLIDVIKKNDLKAIVLVWDEFSDYFRGNRNSLSDFQTLVELCQEAPFYFIIVTHLSHGQLFNQADEDGKKLKDRFDFSEITLPDSIAFDLITDALKVKSGAKNDWEAISGDLNDRIKNSRGEVTQAAGLKSVDKLKGIVPLHPMAAMLLKYISAAFESNQRSMFDFIKNTTADDFQGFQWYIEHYSPNDDQPLLTIDLLWNFFYEHGKQNLSQDIRAILETYPRQKKLNGKEKSVLKTILMMQAIDQRTGFTLDIFKTTEKNVKLAFEGINDLESGAVGIAKKLADDKILYHKPMGDGPAIFASVSLAAEPVGHIEDELRQSITTADLIEQGGLTGAISLNAALSLRYEKITPVTAADFTRTINGLREACENLSESWKFYACIALAKNEAEAAVLRNYIKNAAANKDYGKILFIDALSETLNQAEFEQYIKHEALSRYWNGKDKSQADQYEKWATEVLEKWRTRVSNNGFIVISYANRKGEKYTNAQNVLDALKQNVLRRFKHAFDFTQRSFNGSTKILTESQLKREYVRAPSAAAGVKQQTERSGVITGIENIVLPTVWKIDNYWTAQPAHPVSVIKTKIDAVIKKAFEDVGRISIAEIYDTLAGEFGFAPCDLYAFLTGFLLKEYAVETYRFVDDRDANEQMSSDKLANMITNYIKHTYTPNDRYIDTYIQLLSADEKAFFELTEKVFKIPQNQCPSPEDAAKKLPVKIRELEYPLWCLFEAVFVDNYGVYGVLRKYLALVQNEGKEAGVLVREIGKACNANPNLADNLSALVTHDNCAEGMKRFLKHFENGELLSLANKTGAVYLDDIRKKFEVKNSGCWVEELGKDEIRNLIVEYKIIHESNSILTENANSLQKCFDAWREHLKHIRVSSEVSGLQNDISTMFADIVRQEEFLPARLSAFLGLLVKHGGQIKIFFETSFEIFTKAYALYLDGLNDDDIKKLIAVLPYDLFMQSRQECNKIVNEKADEARRNQSKTRLKALWLEKTASKDPREWSNHHRTPILSLVPDGCFQEAKSAFDTLNRANPAESDVVNALLFLEKAPFLDDLIDVQKRDAAFKRGIIGKFAAMLPDVNETRNYLESKLSIEPSEWYENPNVKKTVEEYAKSRYDAGGSEKALQKIDGMESAKLKEYLKRLVKDNMAVGIEIILTEGDAV
ncbi:MAG: hypothetical protein Pg6C_05240 [Treponemataceae bacterium]|nr:MAG: hypothetical protein Pg6C_05240 [Treponemataceae bacterium]